MHMHDRRRAGIVVGLHLSPILLISDLSPLCPQIPKCPVRALELDTFLSIRMPCESFLHDFDERMVSSREDSPSR
ncbi:Unannotated [Lentimonas sp. CC4]|nr:Unannotated [Lentimonas sp. CC4]CAA7182993.1 Unannotated [Lentimonas sp. CC8]